MNISIILEKTKTAKIESDGLILDLQQKSDKNGKTFYVGKVQSPVILDFSKGIEFRVCLTEGEEKLQIASYSTTPVFANNEIDDAHLVGRLKYPGTMPLSESPAFLIFNAISGSEEIQIVSGERHHDAKMPMSTRSDILFSKEPEVYPVTRMRTPAPRASGRRPGFSY